MSKKSNNAVRDPVLDNCSFLTRPLVKVSRRAVRELALNKYFFQETIQNYIAVCFPDIATQNIGDEIIASAVTKQLYSIFPDAFFVKFPTQTQFGARCLEFYNKAKYRFIGGSNLMGGRVHILPYYNQWDVSFFNAWKYRDAVLMGVGWHSYRSRPGCLAKLFYSPLLSRTWLHSVRDGFTEQQMRSLGYENVINTACPTTWDLTPEHCEAIPRGKRDSAVFTITDYARDPELIQKMLEIIRRHYSELFFFQQGSKDLEYLREITTDFSGIHVIQPTLAAYDALLEEKHPDFIGTRLHGGIRALQHSCRTLIFAIDNRAIELSKDINLPVIATDEIQKLDQALTDGWDIALRIPIENIKKWKSQFQKQ